MKKLVSILLILAVVLSCNVVTFATEDQQYHSKVYDVGDANGDGAVGVSDCAVIRSVLVNTKNVYMNYECADVTGDYVCDLYDLWFLRRKLAHLDGWYADFNFYKNIGDVTDKLEDLGRNNYDTENIDWDDRSVETILARNPNDMIAYKSKVYVAGGNYDTNQGPVRVSYYSRDSKTGRFAGSLNTEQINRFFIYDDIVFTTSIDERTWGSSSVCYLKDYRLSFQEKAGVLDKGIHCYDMEKFKGYYFFAGSAVHYDYKIPTYSGSSLELSKGIIYMYKGEDITKSDKGEFADVPIVNKNGEMITFKTDIVKATANGREYYYNGNGVPRVYDLFIFKGELYALYYDQYMYTQSKLPINYNGLYKFDIQKEMFFYQSDLNIDVLRSYFVSSQDHNKILHDFEWGDNYYLITDGGMLSTADFKTYTLKTIPEVKNAVIRDVIFRDDGAYVLSSELNTDGSYTNYLHRTTDFETYSMVLKFSAKSYARSFEYCNGAFYFGIGATADGDFCNTECGRIYRYVHYK